MRAQGHNHRTAEIDAPGTFEIESKTEFTGIAIRTEVDANNPADVTYVNSLQDRVVKDNPDGTFTIHHGPESAAANRRTG